ncbi:hypothetical protein VNO77_03824 [Canavalia gladiata]|uniref:Uncharacterized protein n=1 Tax=Canavalia gladiata TaxID=3824 RepID=A0AAN9RCL0_CANGL
MVGLESIRRGEEEDAVSGWKPLSQAEACMALNLASYISWWEEPSHAGWIKATPCLLSLTSFCSSFPYSPTGVSWLAGRVSLSKIGVYFMGALFQNADRSLSKKLVPPPLPSNMCGEYAKVGIGSWHRNLRNVGEVCLTNRRAPSSLGAADQSISESKMVINGIRNLSEVGVKLKLDLRGRMAFSSL